MRTELDNDWVDVFGEHYQRLGPETKPVLIDLLPEDWTFDGKRVLDFGSGPGRTLRHFLPEAERGEFWATDIHAPSIAALEEKLCPPMHAVVCKDDPPLGFDQGSFDLIWSISVFTHLAENSTPWLLELHRLLKPGGFLIATYMGRNQSELLADEPWDEDRVGRNVLRRNQPLNRGGPMVLMSDWWVREHWGRAFDVERIAHDIHAMSWVLMRRREVELSVEELERAGDDEREYAALRHNLRQVEREHQAEVAALRTDLEELRNEYEGSISWRLTRPLRAARSIGRWRKGDNGG